MIANSLNIKGLKNGKSLEAQCFPSQNVTNKNPQRERDLTYTRYRQRYLQFFLVLFSMGIYAQCFAQSGNSCGNAVPLGNLKDSIYNLRLAYPQSEKWFSFTSDSSFINLYFGSLPVSNQKIKIDRINLYSSCSTNLTNKASSASPGIKTDKIEYGLTALTTYYIKVERYYNLLSASIDTANKDIKLGVIEGNRSLLSNCSTPCANLLPNGGFECYDVNFALLANFPYLALEAWSYTPAYSDISDYFNINFSIGNPFLAPITTQNSLVYSPPLSGNNLNSLFLNSSEGFIGIETGPNNSDVVEFELASPLTNNQDYYVSYDVTAGRDYAIFNDRIDLDIAQNTPYTAYSDIGYSPLLESGPIGNVWTTKSKAFTATSNQEKIFIGNLAQQNYGTTSTGIGTGTAQYYFVDNVILKPFVVELGNGASVCSGISIPDIIIPCDYIYYGITYTWSHIIAGNPVVIQTGTITQGTETAGNLIGYTPTNSETLTLTITSLNGLTATDTYNITILPGATSSISVTSNATASGVFCNNNGVVSVIGSFVNNLVFETPIADTYQWSIDGNLIAGATNQTFSPGLIMLGNHTVSVHSTILSGCDANATISFSVVANGCQLACATVIGNGNFVAGTNYPNSTTIGFPSQVNGGIYVVDGLVTFSTPYDFTNNHIWMSPGAKMDLIGGSVMSIEGTTIDGCVTMWDRISNKGTLIVSNSTINHAESAIEVAYLSITNIKTTTFNDNVIGISNLPIVNSTAKNSLGDLRVKGTTFRGTNNGFLPAFTTLSGASYNEPPFFEKPASGIYLKNIVAVHIGTDNLIETNVFENMWNGVYFNNCFATIENCRFDGMETGNATNLHQALGTTLFPTPQLFIDYVNNVLGQTFNNNAGYLNWGPYKDAYCRAIVNIGSSSALNIYSLKDDDASNPTIKNCWKGIYNNSGVTRTLPKIPGSTNDYLFIRDVYNAVNTETVVSGILGVGVNLYEYLDIRAEGVGFFINYNTPNSLMDIRNNIIYIDRNDLSYNSGRRTGIRVVDAVLSGLNTNKTDYTVNNPGTANATLNINSNWIFVEEGDRGVELINTTLTSVYDNRIEMWPSTGIYNSAQGVTVTNGASSRVSCNEITLTTINGGNGIATGSQNTENTGIGLYSSENTNVACNNTQNFRDGISVQYPCNGSVLRNNNIGKHRFGLRYKQWANVGILEDRGNIWNGPFDAFPTGAGARAEMDITNQALFNLNQIRAYNTVPNPLYPATIFPNPNVLGNPTWFFGTQNDNPPPCPFVCNIPIEITPPPALMTTELENLKNLATVEPDNSVFSEEKLWMAKNYLLAQLKSKDSIPNDDTLRDFYESESNGNMAKIQDLFSQINKLYVDAQLEADLTIVITQLMSQLNLWNDAIANMNETDAANYLTSIEYLNQQREAILTVHNAHVTEKLTEIEALRAAITASNAIEQNLNDMVAVYQDQFFKEGKPDFTAYENSLAQLAFQCPMAAGKGVYMARAYYLNLHPNAIFNDETLCNAEVGAREQLKQQGKTSQALQSATVVYPNPANTEVNILVKKEALKYFTIKDITGRTVMNTFEKSNTSPIFINTESLQNGVYLIELVFENNSKEIHKLTIQH